MTALNDRFESVLEKTVGDLVGQMTGKMEVQIKEMRQTTQKQLDEAEARVAGMQAALMMVQAVIDKAIGAAPKNGAEKKTHGGKRAGSGRPSGSSGPKVNEEQIAKMLKLYREHPEIGLREIGEQFGISGSYVYLIARRRGLAYPRRAMAARMSPAQRRAVAERIAPSQGRTRGGRTEITPELEKRIWERHTAGLSNRAVAEALGIGHTTVERYIKKHREPKAKSRYSPAGLARLRRSGRLGGLKRAENIRKAREATSGQSTAPESPGVAPTG